MTEAEAFWASVDRVAGCWMWPYGVSRFGYGRTTYQGRRWLTHRLAWMLTHGPIPEGLFVLHHCDTPACIRPDHLFLGTQQDNLRDMREKGRGTNPPMHVGEHHPRWRGGVSSGLAGVEAFKAWHAAYERERRHRLRDLPEWDAIRQQINARHREEYWRNKQARP